jgi:hypothetical protein
MVTSNTISFSVSGLGRCGSAHAHLLFSSSGSKGTVSDGDCEPPPGFSSTFANAYAGQSGTVEIRDPAPECG